MQKKEERKPENQKKKISREMQRARASRIGAEPEVKAS